MTKKKKILKNTLITLGVLILLLVLDILFWLGPTVKFLVQTIGPKALGTPVHIESLSINPRKGTVLMTGFSIENQESYGSSNAVALANLDIAVSMSSLFSDTVTVHRILVDSPYLVFEQNQASDNIAEFIQSLLDFVGYDPDEPPKEKKKKKQKDSKTKITVVESLEINDAAFHLANTDDVALDMGIQIEQLSMSMTNGMVQLKELRVRNPNSLSTKTLFTLEGIDLQIDPATIYNAPLVIQDVQVHKPHAFAEWALDVSTISEFLNIIDRTLKRVAAWPIPEHAEAAEPMDEMAEPKSPPPPELQKARITDIRFHVVNSADPQLSIVAGIEKVEADLTEGIIQLGRIFVTNPKRLATPDLFSLESIHAHFDPATLYAPPLSIHDVQVSKPYVFLENNPETDTVAELIKIADTITESLPTNMTVTAGSGEAPATAEPAETDHAGSAAPPVNLHRLVIDDIQLKLLDTTPTNAPTTPIMLAGISEISTELVEGRIRVENMTIPNPAGFHATNLYHLALISVTIDPETLFSDQVVINDIFIDSPRVNLEQTEEAGNVSTLQTSLMAFVPPADETAETETTPAESPVANDPVPLAEQPVVLESLRVTNLLVSAILLPPPADTNSTPKMMEKGAMESLNPMTYIGRTGTNETEMTGPEPIKLAAYDLLEVKPLEGTIRVSNLQIGNPHGFANEHMVKLDQFGLSLDPDSLGTDTLVITNIHIHKPRVAYERKITTDNIKVFQETIEGAIARREEVIEEAEEEADIEDGGKQKVIIEHLIVEGGIVKAKISALPTTPIPLPTIEMKDIGKEEGGAGVKEASEEVFTAFYDSIIGVVANATGIAGDALKGAGALTFDALGNLTDGIGGLFSSDDEKQEEVQEEKAEPEKKKKRRRPFRSRFHK